jgi:hypothetical protein
MANLDLVALWERTLPPRVRDARCECHDGYGFEIQQWALLNQLPPARQRLDERAAI